jgi:holliday junction DNA helicase RuvA
MIGRLSGILKEKLPPHLLVDVHGVWYELEAPMSTFYQLPEIESPVVLYTHLSVREDAHLLFAFADAPSRILFRQLIKISGVGGRMALAILSGLEVHEFIHCVQGENIARLTKVPGVGKKTAERLIIELRDKLPSLFPAQIIVHAGSVQTDRMTVDNTKKDALNALLALGYKNIEAERAVNKIDAQGLSSEEMIRAVLRQMAS